MKTRRTKKAVKRKSTWRKPKSATVVHVTCVGAGGSGGTGRKHVPKDLVSLDPLWHWKTKEGRVLHLDTMDLSHLINARSLLGRRIIHLRLLQANMTAVINNKLREEGHDSQFDEADETW